MRIVLLGPPGAGKGTQAYLIAQEFGLKNFSTGDIFREILKDSNPLSKKLSRYVNKGELVPDDIVFETIKQAISSNGKGKYGWILDGYPRNKKQAEMLDGLLEEKESELDFAIYISVDNDVLIDRLSSRRVCPECGAIYNLKMNPPEKDERCDICNIKLIQREDDMKETVIKRINIFKREFRTLHDYYSKEDKLIEINGDGSVNEVFSNIRDKIEIG